LSQDDLKREKCLKIFCESGPWLDLHVHKIRTEAGAVNVFGIKLLPPQNHRFATFIGKLHGLNLNVLRSKYI